MHITPLHYLVLSALLFTTGVVGVLLRRNIVVILMSIELILNAVNINLVVFSHGHRQVDGQAFALFVMAVAVSEAAVALGILIALFRNRGTVLADELDLLKGETRRYDRPALPIRQLRSFNHSRAAAGRVHPSVL